MYDKITLALIIVIVLILVFSNDKKTENLEDLFYLDQIAMKSSDPTYVKYIGRDKDILGQSYRDYYLENRMYSNSGSGPQHLVADSAYFNHTNYLGMPEQYRPKPLSKYVKE